MEIINRVNQYKRSPGSTWYQRNLSQIKYLAIHYTAARQANTATDDQAIQVSANHHINNKKWVGLSYHFYIPKSGKIYQINNLTDITWTDGKNTHALAICLDGYFHQPHNEQPTPAQLESLEWLINHLRGQLNIPQSQVLAHRDIAATSCCGDILYKYIVKYRNEGKLLDVHNQTTQSTINNMDKTKLINSINNNPQFDEETRKLLVQAVHNDDANYLLAFSGSAVREGLKELKAEIEATEAVQKVNEQALRSLENVLAQQQAQPVEEPDTGRPFGISKKLVATVAGLIGVPTQYMALIEFLPDEAVVTDAFMSTYALPLLYCTAGVLSVYTISQAVIDYKKTK